MTTGQNFKKIIIGNWKMNPRTTKEAEKLVRALSKELPRLKNTQVVVCPPFIYLEKLKKVSKKFSLGAQDAFYCDTGPFTGEISPEMISSLGVNYVIVGHSERRTLGESNIEINKKIKGVLSSGITPVLCVGEWERDDKHEYYNLVKSQVLECLNGVPKNLIPKVIIAYEPVWALSTTAGRRDATAADCQEMIIFIRKVLADKFGKDALGSRIIYGGSVNERDAGDFIIKGGADGLLAGRASLDPKKFTEIVKICEALNN